MAKKKLPENVTIENVTVEGDDGQTTPAIPEDIFRQLNQQAHDAKRARLLERETRRQGALQARRQAEYQYRKDNGLFSPEQIAEIEGSQAE